MVVIGFVGYGAILIIKTPRATNSDASMMSGFMSTLHQMGRFIRRGGLNKLTKLTKGHFPSLYVGARLGVIIFLGATVSEMLGDELPIRPWQLGLIFGLVVAGAHYSGRLYERTGRL